MHIKQQSHLKRHTLRWHLTVLVVIKISALYLIWLAWFSHPVILTPRQVTDDLLMPLKTTTCRLKDNCDVPQH